MSSISRRNFLVGTGCLSCALLTSGTHGLAASKARFCLNSASSEWGTWIAASPREYAREGVTQAAITTFLDAENSLLSRFFQVEGEYNIMIGYDGAAYDGPVDLIYMGDGKLPGAGEDFHRTSAIFAHETAHRFQIKHGIHAQLSDTRGFHVKYVELHADYMAGAYMAGTGGRLDVQDIFFDLGDLNVFDADHHGFKPERFNAFHRGFSDYRKIAAEHPNDILAVAFGGIQYVRCILPYSVDTCKGI